MVYHFPITSGSNPYINVTSHTHESIHCKLGGSQEHKFEVEELAPDLCQHSLAVTTQVRIAAIWE